VPIAAGGGKWKLPFIASPGVDRTLAMTMSTGRFQSIVLEKSLPNFTQWHLHMTPAQIDP
jgi:hypothetical protein